MRSKTFSVKLDIEGDLRRLREFERMRMGGPYEEAKAWIKKPLTKHRSRMREKILNS